LLPSVILCTVVKAIQPVNFKNHNQQKGNSLALTTMTC